MCNENSCSLQAAKQANGELQGRSEDEKKGGRDETLKDRSENAEETVGDKEEQNDGECS